MNWPRLTETLLGPKAPHLCQSCGGGGDVARWREHDESDRPEDRVVVLCRRCARKVIEPHPRLYAEMQPGEPLPGTMSCCVACAHRDELRCRHGDLMANGGAGLKLSYREPTRAFVCRRDGRGGPTTIYTGPVTCAGQVLTEPAKEDGAP